MKLFTTTITTTSSSSSSSFVLTTTTMLLSSLLFVVVVVMPFAVDGFTFNALNIPSPVLDKFTSSPHQQDTSSSSSLGLLDITLHIDRNIQNNDKTKNNIMTLSFGGGGSRTQDRSSSSSSSSSSCMSLTGCTIQLLPDLIVKDAKTSSSSSSYPPLPGANGPNPKSSTGAKRLVVTHDPSFVNIHGLQTVVLGRSGSSTSHDNKDGTSKKNDAFGAAAWEVVWRDGASCGSLICALANPTDHRRNGAILPRGILYVSFPLWTIETLSTARTLKQDKEDRAAQYLADKARYMDLYAKESNPFKKFNYYRQALTAAELYHLTGVEFLDYVPMSSSSKKTTSLSSSDKIVDVVDDDTIMTLQDDVMLSTQGTLWIKPTATTKEHIAGSNGGGGLVAWMFGESSSSSSNHGNKVQLGTATVRPGRISSKDNNKKDIDDNKGQLKP